MSDYKGCQIMEVNIVQFIVVEVSQNVLDYKECWIIGVGLCRFHCIYIYMQ